MLEKQLIDSPTLGGRLLASIERREAALWVLDFPRHEVPPQEFVEFLGLPWRLVLSEVFDQAVVAALENSNSFSNPMIHKRGFIQTVESDPSQIELPKRSLPYFLLNGRDSNGTPAGFASQLRRLAMLNALLQSGVRDLVILSGTNSPLPQDLSGLWSAGLRAQLHFVSPLVDASKKILEWLDATANVGAAHLVQSDVLQTARDAIVAYTETYPELRRVIRMRSGAGETQLIDVTEVDDPERPVLESYQLLEERDLSLLTPEELPEAAFVDFFRDPSSSWLPFAAGLPWIQDKRSNDHMRSILRKLDSSGSEESCIAYVVSEPGAGGTTLARALAWDFANQGYPVLAAKPVPFVPEALPVVNFLTRANSLLREAEHSPRYEAPWIVLFDALHWQNRESELVRFRNELARSGRAVCILCVATAPLSFAYFNGAVFRRVAELSHAINLDDARALGRHLNTFLRHYGKERPEWQWDAFYNEHTVRFLDGVAAFWVTLSFWIQGQYDLSETVQQWVYRTFRNFVTNPTLQEAILEIAALSTERLPLPESLLPASSDAWPTSQHLDDLRASLGGLGLIRISSDGNSYWALVHDILGRFLLNALFFDGPTRSELGLGSARDSEHLRFLILQKISRNPRLGERPFRAFGEDFATSIFKIDPDHGRGSFAHFWREVLGALDGMPRSLRDTSRVFRHHTAVSRRRISHLSETYYGVSQEDQRNLLGAAINDLTYALTAIRYAPGSEPNLNLYNSLANAYLDLAEVESTAGCPAVRIAELRILATEATRKAYEESPTNSFVIETYVKHLLQEANAEPNKAVEFCIEALGLMFSALSSDTQSYREARLNNLAEKALSILLKQRPPSPSEGAPATAIDVLVKAWTILGSDENSDPGQPFGAIPEVLRSEALEVLQDQLAAGNSLALRLRYDLLALSQPFDFSAQLSTLEELRGLGFRSTPQLELEYAVLLFQRDRAVEGDSRFRDLRRLWHESEHFVTVPDRLKWLRTPDGQAIQVVNAITGSDSDSRAMARVRELGNARVPFRPEEHSIRSIRPNMRLSCHVSFGHNGPFLRPVSAGPTTR